jgi:integrase
MGKLTAVMIRAMRHPGGTRPIRIGDGDGLYLQVAPGGSKSWLFRYTLRGKAREMGLGAAATSPVEEEGGAVPLAAAREAARQAKAQLRRGTDPIEARRASERARTTAAPEHSFRSVADFYVAAHQAGWSSAKFRMQWRSTLERYAFPHFGEMPVAAVGTGEVMTALEPIWTTKPETATRVRGRIEAVLDYAAARGWKEGQNPARWRGHLAKLLPERGKVARVRHHAALPWREIGGFVAELRRRESTAARALELQILTASRSGEVFGMRWGEVDIARALWTVPAARMKAGKEHRIPLSRAALDVLHAVRPAAGHEPAPGAYVLPGEKPGRPLSGMAMLMLLRRMNPETEGKPARWRDARTGEAITPHGFRSSFRDWCAEATAFPRELAEAALAHTLGNKVEAAYERGDLLDKRRRLMGAWATFCARPAKALLRVERMDAVAGLEPGRPADFSR